MFKKQSDYWKTSLVAVVAIVALVGYAYIHVDESNSPSRGTQSPHFSSTELGAEPLNITVYRTPTCGCCKGWVEQIQQHHFQVTDRVKPEAEIQTIREKYNLPNHLVACHTAEINGYLVEGHIPAEDVKQLIAQKPEIAGIAVPGMPIGTPGMEMGERKESFEVFGFKPNGQVEVFNTYSF